MACALALLIAGCATTPVDELERPAFEMPERFARDGDIPMRADWWQTFDDPALDRLVDRALSNNFTLRSAYARVEQARATLAAEARRCSRALTPAPNRGDAGRAATA